MEDKPTKTHTPEEVLDVHYQLLKMSFKKGDLSISALNDLIDLLEELVARAEEEGCGE